VRHLFVTQDYAPDLGGMARRHVELCRRFAPDEVIVSTVAAADGGAFDAGEPYPIRREAFPFDRAKLIWNQVRWARSLIALARRGVDLVHCGNVRPCGYAVGWMHTRTRVPYVLYVYGGDLLRERRAAGVSARKRHTAARIFARARGVVAISDWSAGLAREVMAAVGVRVTPPVAAIDLGTDPHRFHPRRDSGALRARLALGTGPVVLTVARLVPHKGQDVALRALARLAGAFPSLRYLVVGTGPDASRLDALARDLGVRDRVVLAGALGDDEIAEAYALATAYVGLSRLDRDVNVEGFGLSFVEAGASGAPSVAGDSGGVRSAVRDGETGFVVPPTDDEAAAAALRRLLTDDALRAGMGRAARLAVERHFNWDRVARETIDFTRSLVREPVPA
jgi:phosphatidylinositol alpha-1,6-mannosyltransferase